MKLTRRNLIKASAAAAATVASGAALAEAPPSMIVFDSRVAASRAFAKNHTAPRVDVAKEDSDFWRTLRAEAPKGTIIGMTGWSDWVMVRGLLEEKGKRLRSETPSGKLFHWAMG
jgi:hypothetical protein